MQCVQSTYSTVTGLCHNIQTTILVFETEVFVILVVISNVRYSGIITQLVTACTMAQYSPMTQSQSISEPVPVDPWTVKQFTPMTQSSPMTHNYDTVQSQSTLWFAICLCCHYFELRVLK